MACFTVFVGFIFFHFLCQLLIIYNIIIYLRRGWRLFSYISFVNNTGFPYISISEDERVIIDFLAEYKKSKFFPLNSGSISFDVFYNSPKPFLNIYTTFLPGRFYTVEIYKTCVKLHNHLT